MKKEPTFEERWDAVKGKGHDNPSPETKIFMEKITMEIKFIKEKLSNMPTREEMELCNEGLIDRIFEKAEKKFASKLTEKIVYAMVGIIIAGVLAKLLNLI
jgi:hypothetical protein